MSSNQSKAADWFRKIRNSLDPKWSDAEREEIAFLILEDHGVSRQDVFSARHVEIPKEKVQMQVDRICAGEPPQYVLGWSWFCGLRFEVDASVLIPRPETEMLVDLSLRLDLPAHPVIWDLATGSGAIAVALAKASPAWTIRATDISLAALAVASTNATLHEASVEFVHHDVLSRIPPFQEQVDLMVSNPPYIGMDEIHDLDFRVSAHEPRLALFGPEDDVLGFYRALAAIALKALGTGGWLMVEINQRYGQETCGVFSESGFVEVELIKDLSGHDRVVLARRGIINP